MKDAWQLSEAYIKLITVCILSGFVKIAHQDQVQCVLSPGNEKLNLAQAKPSPSNSPNGTPLGLKKLCVSIVGNQTR